MELRHLRYFVAVYAEGSISRAAESLLISQPALTRQIRDLEREMGTPLFERVASGMQPTIAARALHSHALQVLRLAELTREVTRSATPARERVEIGLPPGLPQDWLHRALPPCGSKSRTPRLLSSTPAAPNNCEWSSKDASTSLSCINTRPSRCTNLLFEQPFGIAVRPGHPLADQPVCAVPDLDGLRILVHARDQVPGEHDRMITTANDLGINPHWRFARFTENALLCAEATEADAVLLSEPSAARMMAEWRWSKLVDPAVVLRTWAARQNLTRAIVTAAMDAIAGLH